MIGIWATDSRTIMNRTLAFRKDIQCRPDTKLRIAAANLYRLFINGDLYGYGPARAAHGYSRVDEYALDRFAGQSIVITAEVFSACVNNFYTVDEPPFFAAEIISNGAVLYDARDFCAYEINDRVQAVQRFCFQRTFVESYRMEQCRRSFYLGASSHFPAVEAGEVPVNTLLERGVSYPHLDKRCAELIRRGTAVLRDKPIVTWPDRSLNISPAFKGFAYDTLTECLSNELGALDTDPSSADGTVGKYSLFTLGKSLTGFFSFKARVRSRCVIYVIWDELITPEGKINPFRNACCNGIKYTLAPGEYDLLSFEANTAQYAQVCIFGEAEIDSFGLVLYENPDAKLPDTVVCDGELMQILEAAKSSFAQNAVDLLSDCPSRERAGWLCDGLFTAHSERLFTGDTKVEKNFLENYILAPRSPYLPEGMIPMCYPADHNDGVFIPNWSMWFILQLHDYYEATRDRDLIERAREKVYAILGYFSRFINDEGLLENLEGWVFIEWSRCNGGDCVCGVNFPTNMLYSRALHCASELYGDEALKAQGEALKERIRELSYNGEFFTENCIRVDGVLSSTGILTETCQYYAFQFGIASSLTHPDLHKKLIECFGPKRDLDAVYPHVAVSNAFMGNYFRLELLLRAGLYDSVLTECKDFFTKMARTTGTLWEHTDTSASLVHGFASRAAEYIICALNGKSV